MAGLFVWIFFPFLSGRYSQTISLPHAQRGGFLPAEKILTITTEDQTPLVKALLEKLRQTDELVERQYEEIRLLKEENKIVRDEIAALKKYSKRPRMKPSEEYFFEQRREWLFRKESIFRVDA